jgi:uncharacterized protein YjbI with pentapeptide repeats
VVGYDGGQYVREEKHYVDQKPKRDSERGFLPPPAKDRRSPWGFRGMTVRDWLPIVGALLIPVVIALGTWWITWQQGKIEDRRAKAEREIAEQRAQDAALQAYLDQMSQLMLDRKLLEAEPGNPVHTLAQARTSTAILRLDAEHNESLTRFLSDSGLAGSDESTDGLLRGIALSRATLSGAFLPIADLVNADLSGADFSNAALLHADLSGAELIDAELIDALLVDADLSGAFLPNADLSGANLSGANLRGAEGITNEELEQQAASLEGTTMPNGQKYEDWLKSKGRGEDG